MFFRAPPFSPTEGTLSEASLLARSADISLARPRLGDLDNISKLEGDLICTTTSSLSDVVLLLPVMMLLESIDAELLFLPMRCELLLLALPLLARGDPPPSKEYALAVCAELR